MPFESITLSCSRSLQLSFAAGVGVTLVMSVRVCVCSAWNANPLKATGCSSRLLLRYASVTRTQIQTHTGLIFCLFVCISLSVVHVACVALTICNTHTHTDSCHRQLLALRLLFLAYAIAGFRCIFLISQHTKPPQPQPQPHPYPILMLCNCLWPLLRLAIV